ncbi:MAG: hypothetical protein JWR19_2146 [Pedosphaera sp.]|nr:hypothetical protein [Pedosphaera sp.]
MKVLPCKVRGEQRWKIELGGATGKRKRQFFKDEGEAQQALDAALKDQSDVGRAWEVLTAREKANVMPHLKAITEAGMTLEKVWAIAQSIPNAPKSGCTLKTAVKELLDAKQEANCRPKYIANLKWYLGLFIRGREQLDVMSIGEAELNEWFKSRKEAPRSKRGHIGLLSALFAHCWRKRYVAENPVQRLETVRIDRSVPAVLTFPQCRKAMDWAVAKKPNFLGWLTLALFCGLRPDAECDYIDWSMINLKHSRIVISKSKLRHVPHRIIDLSFCPPALEWLRVAKKKKSPLPLTKITRRRYMRALRDYLKLEKWTQDLTRHTAASNLLAFHQDAGKVAAFLGNSAGVLLRDYKALIFKEDAAKFMELMPKKVKTSVN